MSVQLRGSKWHYRFMLAGKSFSGLCKNCANERAAAEYEMARRKEQEAALADLAEEEKAIRRNKTVRALAENYMMELSGGHPISLEESIELALSKPSRRHAADKFNDQRRLYWGDFVSFLHDNFPEVSLVSLLRKPHCEAYVKYLCENGRYVKEVSYKNARRKIKCKHDTISYKREYKLAPATIRTIIGVCKWVIGSVAEDAGVVFNPWDNVVLPAQDPVEREVFTPAELRKIWDGIQSNSFCYVLFVVAANSGLTEGDICTLRWCEFDWASGYLRRNRIKTGAKIRLPLVPALIEYIQSQPRVSEYVFPQHAEMYLNNPSGVSERVKTFLNNIGIITTVEFKDRRAVSIKDLHSMRHVFCYRAKRAGIPESIIAKFVGHKVVAMTQHYADHDTDDDLREEIKKLPALFSEDAGAVEEDRKRLAELAMSLPMERVVQLLEMASRPLLSNMEA